MAGMELKLMCEGAISGPVTQHAVNNVALCSPLPHTWSASQGTGRAFCLSQASIVSKGGRSVANSSMEEDEGLFLGGGVIIFRKLLVF